VNRQPAHLAVVQNLAAAGDVGEQHLRQPPVVALRGEPVALDGTQPAVGVSSRIAGQVAGPTSSPSCSTIAALRGRVSTRRTVGLLHVLPAAVRTPRAFQSRAIAAVVNPASTPAAASRSSWASSSRRARMLADSYPKGRLPPCAAPAVRISAFFARIRSIMWSTSCRAAAPSIRATIRPDAVAKSSSPAVQVRTSAPVCSISSMNGSNSSGRRCNRSGCHAITASTRPAARSASIRS
jgi:hypothetical protein